MRLALAQWPVERPPGLDAWAGKLDRWIAAAGDAELLVLPEYAAVELGVGLAGTERDAGAEIAAVAAAAPAILDTLRTAARRHRRWVLGGTLPVVRPGGMASAAPLVDPDGRVAWQDKRVPTPWDRELWGLRPGEPPGVFDTPWGRIGIAVCYDVEFPPLVRAQIEAGAWLILVPTCTDTRAGFNRVRLSARARAIENQCLVAVAPTVGDAPWSAGLDTNVGHAAVFGPCDAGFPDDGVIATGTDGAAEWLRATLDPEPVRRVRAEGAVRNHADWPAPPARAEPRAFA